MLIIVVVVCCKTIVFTIVCSLFEMLAMLCVYLCYISNTIVD